MRLSLLLPLLLASCASVPTGIRFEDAQELAARGEYEAALAVAGPLLARDASLDQLRLICDWALRAERPAAACDWANRLLARAPDDWTGRRTRGLALCALERPSQAIDDLEFAHRSGPPDAAVQRALGLALEGLGREPARAHSLLVLSGAEDEAARAARERLDALLHPAAVDAPPAWLAAAALDRATVCRVLDESLSLTPFLLRLQQDRALAGEERASGLRAADRSRAAAALSDLPDEPEAAAALARCVETGLLAAEGTRVRPAAPMARGRFARLTTELLRILEADRDLAPGGAGETPFSDLSTRHPDYAVAATACAVGAMRADGARRFRPGDALSGAELAAALPVFREILLRSPLYQEMTR